MTIHDVPQGSVQWMQLHVGMLSAGALSQLITDELEPRKQSAEMPKTYLWRKVAEAYRGVPLHGFTSWDVEQGTVIEDEARPWFTLETGLEVKQVGFITNDDNSAGCSPDGIIGEDCGLEIKAPAAHTHVKYLLEGILPKEYRAQVYGGLYVTGWPRWIFYSYRRKFPSLKIEVLRDEKINAVIDGVVKDFNGKLAIAKARLEQLKNGVNPFA